MSHADIVKAIESRGGRVVASFTLESGGRVEHRGQGMRGKKRKCTGCGEEGHSVRRCNGPGQPPKPTADERQVSFYAERKAAGLCVRCGTRPAEDDAASCRLCMDRVNGRRYG